MAHEEEISRVEFSDWVNSKVTQRVFENLTERRESLKDYIADGGTIGEKNPRGSTEYYVGRIQGLNDILNVEYQGDQEDVY